MKATSRLRYCTLVGLAHEYPKLDVKTMRVISLEDRIVGMLGHGAVAADAQTPEVVAMAAYMNWLGLASFPSERMRGTGLDDASLPPRAADASRGKGRYQTLCLPCHGATGQGQRAPLFEHGGGYKVPPLAGDDAFDDAGHMYLVPLLARFIHSAMPLGATHEAPIVSLEDAYDIAAYVDSALPRCHSQTRADLYPDRNFRAPGFATPEIYLDSADLFRAKFGPF